MGQILRRVRLEPSGEMAICNWGKHGWLSRDGHVPAPKLPSGQFMGVLAISDSGLVLMEGTITGGVTYHARRHGGDSGPVNFWLGQPIVNGRYRYTKIEPPSKFAIYDGASGLIGPWGIAPNGDVNATGNCNHAKCGFLGTFLFKRRSDGRYARPQRLIPPIGGVGAYIYTTLATSAVTPSSPPRTTGSIAPIVPHLPGLR